ncbi:hypothetical protein ES703_94796 [subsurface metagenome]
MARYRKKKALYEVIGKAWPKPGSDKTLEQLPPEKSDKERPAGESTTRMPERVARWPKRPRIVQFNAGKIEVSIPYQVAIALLLGVILLVLIAFRLGQRTKSEQGATTSNVERAVKTGESSSKVPNLSASETKKPAAAVEKPKGNNRIVIQTYRLRTHLEPVKQYFAQFGIETEIKKIGDWYYLVTKDKYENPEKSGTDGYFAKQKIIELGAKYKAPQGYETFAPNFFKDAFGQRFDD